MLAHSLRLVLPEDHGARLAQRSGRRRRRAGGFAPTRASDPAVVAIRSRGVDVVLDEDGDAVERPARPLLLSLAVEGLGDRQRVGVQLDDAPKARPAAVDLVDPGQVLLDEGAGRQLPLPHPLLEVADRRLGEVERAIPGRSALADGRSHRGGKAAGESRGDELTAGQRRGLSPVVRIESHVSILLSEP